MIWGIEGLRRAMRKNNTIADVRLGNEAEKPDDTGHFLVCPACLPGT